jgi:hypothetical protein
MAVLVCLAEGVVVLETELEGVTDLVTVVVLEVDTDKVGVLDPDVDFEELLVEVIVLLGREELVLLLVNVTVLLVEVDPVEVLVSDRDRVGSDVLLEDKLSVVVFEEVVEEVD